jgi:hypothetical protein
MVFYVLRKFFKMYKSWKKHVETNISFHATWLKLTGASFGALQRRNSFSFTLMTETFKTLYIIILS